MSKLNFIEKKGDVEFSSDSKGKLYQKIGSDEPFKVKDGRMTYRTMQTVSGVTIKYNTNGVYGFSTWKAGRQLEDNIWILSDAKRIAEEIADKGKKRAKPEVYQCGSCEREFKKLKDDACPHCGSGNFAEGHIDD